LKINIFDIELSYQELRKKLSKNYSPYYKIVLISSFLKELFSETDINKYESYFFEFRPALFGIINQYSFACCDPSLIDSLLEIIGKSDTLIPENQLSDTKVLISSLEIKKKDIEDYLNTGKEYHDNIIHSYSLDSVNIVLLEQTDEPSRINIDTGFIYKLRLKTSPCDKSEIKDIVEFRNSTEHDIDELTEHLCFVTGFAKKHCLNDSIKIKNYNYTFWFDEQHCIYAGKSLGIGAMALVHNSILLNEFNDYYYKFNDNTVFTAEIDKHGQLKKLDSESLVVKIKTVFFSRFKNFVIPEDNITEAKHELSKLNIRYPNRNLNLIPISNCQTIFKNLDIIQKHDVKITEKIRHSYKKYSKVLNVIFSVISLAAIISIILFFIIPRMDRGIASQESMFGKYVLYNKHNIELWRSELIDKQKFEAFNPADYTRSFIGKKDSTGENMFIYLNTPDTSGQFSRSVFCIGSGGKPLWSLALPEKKIKHNESFFDDKLVLWGINQVKTRKDNLILYYGNLCEYYPYTLGLIDFNGKVVSEFWNQGYITAVLVVDYNKDNVTEILAGACNNKKVYNCAALAVFDSENINGSSPYSDLTGSGVQGSEMYYILFPRTYVLDYTAHKGRNGVERVYSRNNKISACTYETEAKTQIPLVIYDFDTDFNLLNVSFSDEFIIEYNQLQASKIIPASTTIEEYTTILKSKVLWWNGDEFVSTPAMNKNYKKNAQ